MLKATAYSKKIRGNHGAQPVSVSIYWFGVASGFAFRPCLDLARSLGDLPTPPAQALTYGFGGSLELTEPIL